MACQCVSYIMNKIGVWRTLPSLAMAILCLLLLMKSSNAQDNVFNQQEGSATHLPQKQDGVFNQQEGSATHPQNLIFPRDLTLRAQVVHAPPFAIAHVHPNGITTFSGLQVELMEALKVFTAKDNVNLAFNLEQSPPTYAGALDFIANDCNTTSNPKPAENCEKSDLVVRDYWPNGDRWYQVDFTPSWLKTTFTSMKYLEKEGSDFTTFAQVVKANAKVCTIGNSSLPAAVLDKNPKLDLHLCVDQAHCIQDLKAEKCVLYTDDELQLRFHGAKDATVEITNEKFNSQNIVWPLRRSLDFRTSFLLKKWLYQAVSVGLMDTLFSKYFDVELCPIGWSGPNCDQHCDPNHGSSDRRHVCVCESTRWTGDDCSVEVKVNTNSISTGFKSTGTVLFGINVITSCICIIWLWIYRKSIIVKVAQPFFLCMVLFGCLISSSTIIALGEEDGSAPGCMAIPWLYSVGFW